MLLSVLSGYGLALVTPWLRVWGKQGTAFVVALLPALLTAYFACFLPVIAAGEVVQSSTPWMPGLGIELAFFLDGLSLLFALLICGIGTFIFIYAGSYLRGHADLGKFLVIMLCFMASMLGLVLSDNLITLFVFWELTSITSYLLIGFNHQDEQARKCALQGLFITVGGGLAMMAGFILMAQIGGSYQLSELLAQGDVLREHPYYAAILVCVLLGAFTKSAQFPFHFWLPNAMAAPTPVSAYLHSATMVKAGVYLLARLHPALGSTPLWQYALISAGAITLAVASILALRQTDMKRMLAYSTLMALGTLTLLLGVGTPLAIVAFVTFLLAHSLYKGALFMWAGAIDHATGTRDITQLGGLGKRMPRTWAIGVLAALSFAGIPPLFGFIGKELLLDALWRSEVPWQNLVVGVAVLAAITGMALALVLSLNPFRGELRSTPKVPREAPWGELAGPAVLAFLSLLFGILPWLLQDGLVSMASLAVSGEQLKVKLALWHGVNAALLLSLLSFALGALLWRRWQKANRVLNRLLNWDARWGPESWYFRAMDALPRIANWQTRLLQNGNMGNYLITLILSTVCLVGYALYRAQPEWAFALEGMRFHEYTLAALLVAGAVFACLTPARLAAVASVGVVGFSVALVFLFYSAPDLAITQVLVETLTVILLVLVLFRLPRFNRLSTSRQRIRDAIVALLGGGLMCLLILASLDIQYFDSISQYHIENSAPVAYGRNVVNVILVDFRALDTLGEIFVLALAAIGVYSMIHLRAEDKPTP